ncbi:MAG: lamin tail domain-containing protein [Leptolinea sp.]
MIPSLAMNPWKRLLFYLILNVIVSAITTLTVLSLWDRNHRLNIQPVAQLAATVTQQAINNQILGTPVPASQPTGAGHVSVKPAVGDGGAQIENVFGVGDLETEVVLLKRTGEGELWVTGWRLEDENNHRFTFPELMLNKDGAIKIYSKPGTNSVIELYWGLKEPVWATGELVSLVDQDGAVRATYRVP